MNLVASLIVRNERGRYIEPCVAHLLEFCDSIRILDDHSDDGTLQWLEKLGDRVCPLRHNSEPSFFKHEGKARQALLDWTLHGKPTHVLAIDADEFVADGQRLRETVARLHAPVYTLDMQEVWELDGDCVCVRQDGGWRAHPVPMVYAVPAHADRWTIHDRALACGRVPVQVERARQSAKGAGVDVLHFGWCNEAEREQRHHRYVVADGGRFHASAHLDSIMWPAERVTLTGLNWSPGLAAHREAIVAKTGWKA